MNVLLLLAHSIAEYDDLRMLTNLGYDVFSIGAYSDPANPGDQMRPALPTAPDHPELRALCVQQREKHAGESEVWSIDWAKADLHPDLIDWADVIICHHYLDRWIVPQWQKLRHKRVIWRTCGQSDPNLERRMLPLARDGLQIVRYSPAEERTFAPMGTWAGQDALIRFGKYVDDYGPWIGDGDFLKDGDPITGVPDRPFVGNITQNMRQRGDHCGLSFWLAATEGLPAHPAGPGSEELPGGLGSLSYDEMREYLRRCRAYLFTGTVPASYTLGLIEAMLSGVPVVSIGPHAWLGPPELLESHEIAEPGYDYPAMARVFIEKLLAGGRDSDILAYATSHHQRKRAVDLFDVRLVGQQWVDFLGTDAARTFRLAQQDFHQATWSAGDVTVAR